MRREEGRVLWAGRECPGRAAALLRGLHRTRGGGRRELGEAVPTGGKHPAIWGCRILPLRWSAGQSSGAPPYKASGKMLRERLSQVLKSDRTTS